MKYHKMTEKLLKIFGRYLPSYTYGLQVEYYNDEDEDGDFASFFTIYYDGMELIYACNDDTNNLTVLSSVLVKYSESMLPLIMEFKGDISNRYGHFNYVVSEQGNLFLLGYLKESEIPDDEHLDDMAWEILFEFYCKVTNELPLLKEAAGIDNET